MGALKKILVVDDSVAETRLIQAVLEQAGYLPVALNDPTRVEATLEIERPLLILMDVVMPRRNGFQVCRDLKGNAQFRRIPIVLVTSKNTSSDRFWAQQQGADGFVSKPFTPEELLGEITRFV